MEQWNICKEEVMEQNNGGWGKAFRVYKPVECNVPRDEEYYYLKKWISLKYINAFYGKVSREEFMEIITGEEYEGKEIKFEENSLKEIVENIDSYKLEETKESSEFESYERYLRDVIKKILIWICGEGNIKWEKRSKDPEKTKGEKTFYRQEDLDFINYLVDMYYCKGIEYHTLKNGMEYFIKSKHILNEESYSKFLNGIKLGIKSLGGNRYITLNEEGIEEHWREKYELKSDDSQREIESEYEREVKNLLSNQEILNEIILKLLEQNEKEIDTVKKLNCIFDEFLDEMFENKISEFHILMRKVIRSIE